MLCSLQTPSSDTKRPRKPLDFDTQSPGLFTSSPGAGPSLYGSLDGSSGAAIEGEEGGIAPETLFDGGAIDDLIASLDQPHDLTLQPSSISAGDQVQSLLTDANEFVKDTSGPGFTTDVLRHETKIQKDDSIKLHTHNDDDNSSSDEGKDEAEAARYVESILNEVSVQHLDNPQNHDLPTQEPPEPHDNNKDDENVDDALSQRLTALSLPSILADLPGNKKERDDDERIQAEFCCVCYDTATTKCLDCEGNQFFCVRCWKEMHVGEEAIWADQPHKSVKYDPYKR